MKKIIIIFLFLFLSTFIYSQDLKSIDSTFKNIDSTLKKIDTTLIKIDLNVKQIKDKAKKDEESFSGQTIFEDRKGSSAIFLPKGGIFKLNTADASLKLSYVDKLTSEAFFYGFDISGKTNNGILPLITNGDISPGARINGILGIQKLFKSIDWLSGWVVLKLGYEGTSFKLFNPGVSFTQQINKVPFSSFNSQLSFNLAIWGNKLLAVSVGYQKANNYEDLTAVDLKETKTIIDSASNTIRTYENNSKVRIGDYKVFDLMPINVDFFWTPNDNPRIGFYHYWRTNINLTDNTSTNGFGSGIYLLKEHSLLSAVAGIVFEIKDVSKLKDGFKDNFIVNFVVGYNFNFDKKSN